MATNQCATSKPSYPSQPHPASELIRATFTQSPSPRVGYPIQSSLQAQNRNLPSKPWGLDHQESDKSASLPQSRGLDIYLSLCNTALGVTGLASALCFGVVSIAQSNTANEEAKRANDIAEQSLLMSGLSTCLQFPDTTVSITCS